MKNGYLWRVCTVALPSLMMLFISGCGDSTSPEDKIQGIGIPTNIMAFHAVEQHSMNWCWAASAQMALSTQSVRISQEAIVAGLFGDLVDSPGGLPHFLALCDQYDTPQGAKHVTCECGEGPPPLVFLIDSLANHRPVILACSNPGTNSGHAVVATAVLYENTDTGPKLIRVIVRDPWPTSGKRMLEASEYAHVMYHAVYKATPVFD